MKERGPEAEGKLGAAGGGGGGWKRPLFFVVLAVFLLSATYYIGYVRYGRDLRPPLYGCYPSLGQNVRGMLYQMWTPLRDWEGWWGRASLARSFSGTWESASGQRLEIRVDSDLSGRVNSETYSWGEFSGQWWGGASNPGPSAGGRARLVLREHSRGENIVQLDLAGGVLTVQVLPHGGVLLEKGGPEEGQPAAFRKVGE